MPDITTIIGYLTGFYLIDPEFETRSLVPTLIAVHLFDGILCAIIARQSGRHPGTWGLIGVTLGVWGVLPLLLLPARPAGKK